MLWSVCHQPHSDVSPSQRHIGKEYKDLFINILWIDNNSNEYCMSNVGGVACSDEPQQLCNASVFFGVFRFEHKCTA